MNEENQVYFVDSDKLPEEALKRKHRLEQDPTFRTNHMEYMEGMQVIQSDIKDKVLRAMEEYDYTAYTAADVERALSHESCSIEDFKALLSSEEEITLDTDLLDIDEWDSFSAMSFLAMIEEKYGIKVEPFAIAEAILVEDLYEIVKNN